MSNSRARYVLHGGYSKENNELNRKFYASILEGLPEPATFLCVYFARAENIWDKLLKDEKRMCKVVAPDRKINFKIAKEETFESDLAEADAVYIRGGETPKLEKVLRKYPGLKKLFGGKTVAGSSAGAQFLSTHYYSRSRDATFDGSGILPLNVFCHYGSEGEDHSAMLAKLKRQYPDLETVVLKDCESVVREA